MERSDRRTVLGFALVRPAGDDVLEHVGQRIGGALGCALAEEHVDGTAMLTGRVLGMTIELRTWPSPGGDLLFLRGHRPWATIDDSVFVEIDQAVSDLLADAGLGRWSPPTREQLDAVSELLAAWERAFDHDG